MPAVSRSQPGRPARLVYVRSFTDENIWRIDTRHPAPPPQSPPAVAIASTKADIHPQLSPDGRRVAFTSTRSGAGRSGYRIPTAPMPSNSRRSARRRERVSRTGRPMAGRLSFASDAEGQFDIFIVPSVWRQAAQHHVAPCVRARPELFARRKMDLLQLSAERTVSGVESPVSGGEPVQVTKDGGWLSEESADGAYLYFTATPAVGARTPLWRIPTSRAVRLSKCWKAF